MALEGGHLLERDMGEFSATMQMLCILFEAMCLWVDAFVKNH